jgi:hypothetical protein
MDEKDLVKIGADAAMKPFASLIEKLFGGPVEEIGGMWQDSLKVRRLKRQVKLLEKVERIIVEARSEPHRIPDNISIPLLTAATLEDDDTMQERWATLLAAVANSAVPSDAYLSYVAMLAELTPRQACFLDAIYSRSVEGARAETDEDIWPSQVMHELETLAQTFSVICGLSKMSLYEIITYSEEFHSSLDVYVRLGIVQKKVILPIDRSNGSFTEVQERYHLSNLGQGFLQACSAPGR